MKTLSASKDAEADGSLSVRRQLVSYADRHTEALPKSLQSLLRFQPPALKAE